MAVTHGVLGGTFDPPHNGHLALALGGMAHFELARLHVRVVALPGHKRVATPAAARLALTRLAFESLPGVETSIDPHGRTVDSLRALGLPDPVFLIGADELAGFLDWKDPNGVLELARLGVGSRPGVAPDRLQDVLKAVRRPERIELFEIDAHDLASTQLRTALAAGGSLDGLVPESVGAAIERLGLYRAA